MQLYNRGVELHQQKKFTLAESAFRRAISLHPHFAEAHNNLGNVLKDCGKWKAAEKSYRRALEIIPHHAMLLSNIGNALEFQDKLDEAVVTLEEAIRRDPNYAFAYNNLGNVLVRLGRIEEAIENYKKALVIQPGIPETQNNLGAALCKQERYEESVAVLDETVRANPHFIEAYLNLGEAANKLGSTRNAITVLNAAIQLQPDNDAVYGKLAEVLFDQQRFLEARSAISMAMKIDSSKANYASLMGQTLRKLNLLVEAESWFRQAAAMNPKCATYHLDLGELLCRAGKKQEGLQAMQRAIRLNPAFAEAYRILLNYKVQDKYDEHMVGMEALLQRQGLPDADKCQLNFALGKAYDDLGDFEKAAHHFIAGNRLENAKLSCGSSKKKGQFERVSSVFSAEFIRHHEQPRNDGRSAIFITGLSRSGKTLVETILSAHPLVTAGEESIEFFDKTSDILDREGAALYPEGVEELDAAAFVETGQAYMADLKAIFNEAAYVTNTHPGNALYIGMIRLCLPGAKVILCERDPNDACVEVYKRYYSRGNEYSYDMVSTGEYFRGHYILMEHWRRLFPDFVRFVQFEEFVRNPEKQIKSLLDFCGLPWDDSCLKAAQDTLPDREDVFHVWERYREPFRPLFETLNCAGEALHPNLSP